MKGPGFLGALQRSDGGISTELSVGVNFDGKETQIPSIVPTLNAQEVQYLQGGGDPRSNPAIMEKAINHAKKRTGEGKSPFVDDWRSNYATAIADNEPPTMLLEGFQGSDSPTPTDPDTPLGRFEKAVYSLPPEQQANVIAAQNKAGDYRPVAPEDEPGPYLASALEFTSPITDMMIGVPSALVGEQQPTVSSVLPPPRSQAEAVGRGLSMLGGTAASFMAPSGPLLAAKGAQLGARALGAAGRLPQYAAGISGFMAPEIAGRAISGEISPIQAAHETLTAPIMLPYDIGKATVEGSQQLGAAMRGETTPEETLRGFETIAPAASIGLLHSLKPKAKPGAMDKPVEGRPIPLTAEEAKAKGVPAVEQAEAEAPPKPGILKRLLHGDQAALPLEVAEADFRRMGKIAETSAGVRFDIKDLNDSIKRSYPKGQTKEDSLAIDAVLKGEDALHRLPEPLQKTLPVLRDKIDAMSRKLIDSGAAEGPIELTIEKNQGFYVTRAYQKYNDPKWANRVPEEVRDKAKALLRSEYPEATESEIAGKIESIIYNKSAAESPIALLAKGRKLGSKDLSILKRRQDIAPEIRALMGEYKDARFNYANSMEKMSRLISNHQFLTEVRDMGMGKFLHEKPAGEAYAKVAAPESSAMEPLNGLYTTPEIAKAFEAFRSVQDSPAWLRLYMKANAAVKAGKTIYSPITHVRNTISGAATALAAGNWNPKRFKEAFTAAKTNLTGRGSEGAREYVKKLTRYGLLNQDTRAGELERLARGVEASDPLTFAEKMAEGPAKKILRAPAEAYQAEDNLWRVFHYEGELAKYKRAFPEMPVEQLEKGAAQRASDIYQNYSKVPKNIKALAKFPLIGNFPSFTYELFRTGHNLLALTAKELADPKTRAIGAQRAVGILLAAGGSGAATMAARHINGITREEDDDLRKFMPPWSQNGQILYTHKAADGKLGYIDLSYSDYYGQLKAPIVALMRGEDWKSALWEGTTQLLKPFADEEILAGKLVEAASNKRASGGPVYNEQAPELDKRLAQLEHIWSGAVEPGAISSGRRIAQGLSGKMNEYGTQRDATVETLNVLTGQRRQTIDVRQSLSFAARRFSNQTREAGQLLTGPATRRGEVAEADVRAGVQQAEGARRSLFGEMTEMVSAARRMGIPDKELFGILVSGGIAKQDAAMLVRGRYAPQRMGQETLQRIQQAPGGKERLRAIMDESKKKRE